MYAITKYRQIVVAAFFIACLWVMTLVLVFKLSFDNKWSANAVLKHPCNSTLVNPLVKEQNSWEHRAKTLLHERNELSGYLNEARQAIGQLECSSKRKGDVANSGGWCSDVSGQNSSEHQTDTRLEQHLASFFKDKRVGSFGDGPGIYRQYFDSTGLLQVYDAYDGAPYASRSTNGSVKFLDLSIPQYGLPIYDWILSLEVAEHIPAKYQDNFLSNIGRHAKTGIILSWAVPGQGGYHHVNNRDLTFVVSALKKLGFERNITASKLLRSHASLSWLIENTNVYYRQAYHPINEYDA